MGPPHVCFSLLLASWACIGLVASVRFAYEAETRVGGDYPSPSTSSISLQATLDWAAGDDVIVMRLSNVMTSLYNGPTNGNARLHSEFLPLADGAGDLLKPFTVHLQAGSVIGLSQVDGEADWSVNMKRSIASLAQVDRQPRNASAFIVKETGLFGSCDAEYNTRSEGDRVVTRKYLDHASCSGFGRLFHTNVPLISPYCPGGQDDYLTSTSEVTHTHTQGHLVAVQARGALYVQPFKAQGELQQVLTSQRLTLTPHPSASVPSGLRARMGEIRGLQLALPTEGGDMTQGRNPLSQATLARILQRILLEISSSLDAASGPHPDLLHDERVPQALYMMAQMQHTQLAALFGEYARGTSYQQETLRTLFLELLSRVGTRDSVLLIRDVVVNKLVEVDDATKLLQEFPFHLHRPSEDLLQECEALQSLPEDPKGDARDSGILAFATLVYQTCRRHCSPDVQDKYVRRYFDLFKAAPTYHQQMLYLEGLSNMEDGRVFEYLEPVIRSGENNHLRFLAVWATMNKAMMHPHEVYALYWPILSDRSESVEMRVAALTMLVVSRPSVGRFFSLHWFMSAESNPRLTHFYYTTLQSLVHTRDPCYALMSNMAAKVLRLLPVPAEKHWATGNYILDQGNQELGFGGMAQLFLVANQLSELPTVFYLLVGSHAVGQHFNQMSVYVKMEGVSNEIRKHLLSLDPASISVPQLANLLRQIRAAPSDAEPLHVEVLVKTEGRVVMCMHVNQTNFQQMTSVVSALRAVTNEQHINLQEIDNELLTTHTVMTPLGMPAVFMASVTHVASVRGNVSQVSEEGVVHLINRLDVRMSATAVNDLAVYNPLHDLWHRVQRSTNLRYVLPIHAGIRLDAPKDTFTANLVLQPDVYAGLLSHARSSVFVWGAESVTQLHTHCPQCQSISTLSRGQHYRHTKEFLDLSVEELGARVQGQLFDCEHQKGFQAVLAAAVRTQNYQVFPASRPLVIAAHMLDSWLMVAPPGSCGTEVKLTTLGQQPTELEMSLQFLRSSNSARLSLTHKTGSTVANAWTVQTQCQPDHLSINVIREAPTEEDRQFCVNALISFPSSPTNKLSQRPSDPLSATATFHMAVHKQGDSTCGGQPAETLPIAVNIVAEITEEQATLLREAREWPFDACKSGNAVDACDRAAHEMATLRKYTFAVNYSAPLDSQMFLLSLGPAGTLTASAEVSASRPIVLLTVGSDSFTVDLGRRWLEPFLVNTRYPLAQQVAMVMGLITPEQAAT